MPQRLKLGDYLKAINLTKEKLMDVGDAQVEKDYLPFIINRCLSYFADTVMLSNEMNLCAHLDKKLQFDFYINIVRVRKRFKKFDKRDDPALLEQVKEYYGCNNEKALEYMRILSKDNLNYIEKKLERGGKK